MNYYEVLVRLPSYHGRNYLTYSCEQKLMVGSIVEVNIKKISALAVVICEVTKPSFATKIVLNKLGIPSLPRPLVQMINWLSSYYPAPLGSIAQLVLPSTLSLDTEMIPRTVLTKKVYNQLTQQQEAALRLILNTKSTVLVHGNTGTGKTRLYLERAQVSLDTGRSVLLLTPEIGLVPQLLREAEQFLGLSCLAFHSQLTPAQRHKTWLTILSSRQPVVVVGTRSALFCPLDNVGLIAVDEFHDQAYKQEQAPHYLATRLASKLAELHNAQLLLGSATPPVQDYYLAEQKKVPIVRLTQPARPNLFKPVETILVDLKQRQHFADSPYLSTPLLKAVRKACALGEQSLIFLNRRGSARLILCQSCGWQSVCPACDQTLTYHNDNHKLRCHLCGFISTPPIACPECGANNILFSSAGTKTITSELMRLFPEAIVQRFDADNLKSERLEQNYNRLVAGEVDILVGTQLLSKGIDLPRLSVVGVIAADSSLSFPDYNAAERTYQQLSQILGRIGRGHRSGVSVIQSYHIDSKLIKAATTKDWEAFYSLELQERKLYNFPPFCYLLCITFSRASATSAEKSAQKVADQLIRDTSLSITVLGPSPRLPEKSHRRYHWHIIVKAKKRTELIKVTERLPANCSYDLDPLHLL